MITLKLHITHLEGEDFVHEKQVRFSNALILMYNRLDECKDKEFINRVTNTRAFKHGIQRRLFTKFVF